jgi:trimethylguanosine synthase
MIHSSSDDDDNATVVAPRLAVTNLLMVGTNVAAGDETKAAGDSSSSSANKSTAQTMDLEENTDIVKRSGEDALVDATEMVTKKEKKKKRKNKLAANLPVEIANDKTLLKYWYKRFSLFSLFDLGVKLDRGGLA